MKTFKDWCCRTSHTTPVLIAAGIVGVVGTVVTFWPLFFWEVIKHTSDSFAVGLSEKK